MRRCRGLTLIEILVAFGILALLVAVVHTAFSAGLRGWSKSDYVVQAAAVGRMALEQMAREIGSAMVDGNSAQYYCIGYDGPSGMRTGSKADEFYFIAPLNPGDSDYSDLCEAGYWCDGKQPATPQDDVLYRWYVRDDRAIIGGVREFDFNFVTGGSHELVANVTDLQFTYYDRLGAAFSVWDSRLRSGPPTRIEMSVTVMVGKGSRATNPDFYTGTFTTSVFLPNGV